MIPAARNAPEERVHRRVQIPKVALEIGVSEQRMAQKQEPRGDQQHIIFFGVHQHTYIRIYIYI